MTVIRHAQGNAGPQVPSADYLVERALLQRQYMWYVGDVFSGRTRIR